MMLFMLLLMLLLLEGAHCRTHSAATSSRHTRGERGKEEGEEDWEAR